MLLQSPALAGFRVALLVPAWGEGVAAADDESPVIVEETLLRTLRALGGGTACVTLDPAVPSRFGLVRMQFGRCTLRRCDVATRSLLANSLRRQRCEPVPCRLQLGYQNGNCGDCFTPRVAAPVVKQHDHPVV
jgi:hypothetical protein